MKILDSEIDIDTNKSLLFKEYRTFFVMVVVTALMDAVSTMYFMELIGPHVEMNPIVRVLSFSLWNPGRTSTRQAVSTLWNMGD